MTNPSGAVGRTQRARESNFRYLFAGLVALLVIEPIGDVTIGRLSDRLLGLLLAMLLLVGLWGLHPSRRWLRVGQTLTALTLVLSIVGVVWPVLGIQIATFAVASLFLLLSAAIGLRQILAEGAVTADHLLGAATVYLLLGVTWALLFTIIHRVAPNAFHGVSRGASSEFLYFSFVTLATLGYGDITPVDAFARTVVYLEAIAGQFYVAVLVASLVSRHVASR